VKGTAKKPQTKSNGHRASLGGLLARHPFAKDLSEGHLDSLASCAKLLVCMPGDFLWRQGEKPEVVYLVSSGHVALEIAIPNQGSLEIDSFESGDFLPWLWLGGEYRRHFDARVMMPGEVIALDGKVLRALCEHDHDFGYHLLKRLARATEDRLQSARLKIMELQGHSLPVGGSLS
jgi:CRP-like cAMP-binding protein